VRRGAIVSLVLIAAVVATITTGVAVLVGWLPDQASVQRERIDGVFWLTTWICIGIWALVSAVVIYSVVKFRAGAGDESDGKSFHGHTGLEIVWTAVPTVLVVIIGIASAIALTRNERAGDDALRVQVMSQQFAWSFTYPGGRTEPQLRVPLNRTVVLELEAREVIHSFWVPEWGQKQDAVPGIVTRLVITPTKTGTFPVICTELCGLGHAKMRTQAIVLEEAEFEQWLREETE
jgi:cytochrome c oxidase subunit 2